MAELQPTFMLGSEPPRNHVSHMSVAAVVPAVACAALSCGTVANIAWALTLGSTDAEIQLNADSSRHSRTLVLVSVTFADSTFGVPRSPLLRHRDTLTTLSADSHTC